MSTGSPEARPFITSRSANIAIIAVACALLGVGIVMIAPTVIGGPDGSSLARDAGYAPALDDGATHAGDLLLALETTAEDAGTTEIGILVADADGSEVAITRVAITAQHESQTTSPVELVLQPLHPQEHYLVWGVDLSRPGEWRIDVTVERDGLAPVETFFLYQSPR